MDAGQRPANNHPCGIVPRASDTAAAFGPRGGLRLGWAISGATPQDASRRDIAPAGSGRCAGTHRPSGQTAASPWTHRLEKWTHRPPNWTHWPETWTHVGGFGPESGHMWVAELTHPRKPAEPRPGRCGPALPPISAACRPTIQPAATTRLPETPRGVHPCDPNLPTVIVSYTLGVRPSPPIPGTSMLLHPTSFRVLRSGRSQTGLFRSRLRPTPAPHPRPLRPRIRPALPSQPQPSSPTRQKIRPQRSPSSAAPLRGRRCSATAPPFTPHQLLPPARRTARRPAQVSPPRPCKTAPTRATPRPLFVVRPLPFAASLSNPFAVRRSNPFTLSRWNPFVVSRADVPGGPSRTMNGFHPAPAARAQPTRCRIPAMPMQTGIQLCLRASQNPPRSAPPRRPSYPRRQVSIRAIRASQTPPQCAPPRRPSYPRRRVSIRPTRAPQTPPQCAPPHRPSYPRRRVSIRPTRAPQTLPKCTPPQVKSFF